MNTCAKFYCLPGILKISVVSIYCSVHIALSRYLPVTCQVQTPMRRRALTEISLGLSNQALNFRTWFYL